MTGLTQLASAAGDIWDDPVWQEQDEQDWIQGDWVELEREEVESGVQSTSQAGALQKISLLLPAEVEQVALLIAALICIAFRAAISEVSEIFSKIFFVSHKCSADDHSLQSRIEMVKELKSTPEFTAEWGAEGEFDDFIQHDYYTVIVGRERD